ncbi:Crotonobetainyl-CoA:carnitine CoA-transferase CaiB [Halobiforma haloterrestris]|uniref:Crotonobetainyl-CoA:carnitine CoA-transferase CaiB n=1 Tax=Natronobacterium haloterrestre TaxID=148448 RepID=A0A1I1L7V9_NATHA|nr:CaiB/BaiF CoA-transferase family protein [Halobiforma haloterrestris]SFC69089.1 Crotonobetainyl-CoA:carnitine CoA-transferase CaiB [Halobiforma haloterrestris]
MTTSTDTPTNRPLEDTTVIELGHIAAGPFCSLLLAELGADVIKIEHGASGGDSVRGGTPVGNSLFNAVNRNKRGISLDLKTDGGMEAFRDLITTADVFVENLRPGAPEKLGIGYDDLRNVNPELVYCSIKGFNEGPYEDYPALDPVAEALSGLMSVTGHPDKSPARAGTSVADMTAALFGAFGITAALRQREHTGTGQHVTAPLFESTVSLMGYWLVYAQAYDTRPEPLGAGHDNWAPYDVYQTTDDRWVFVGPSSQAQWERLCEALGLQLHEEDRFETVDDRRRNEDALDDELQGVIGKLTADELVEGLHDVGVPVAPVQNVDEVPADEHLAATDALGEIETAEGESTSVSVPKLPLRSSQFQRPEPTDPPELGADTDAVLRDLGYSDAEIESLRNSGCL